MQVTSNTTGMLAEIAVATDKHGRDHCVAVVKGTFSVGKDGSTSLADEQEPFVYADSHYGDPGSTSIKYECDFAPFKPYADILVNGNAHARDRTTVESLTVGLEIGPIRKSAVIVGDRYWERGASGFVPTPPEPFATMPLVYERAFGGSDDTDEREEATGSELRNLVGVGFRKNGDEKVVIGTPLPNLEHPSQRVRHWSSKPMPIGFGVVGRNWQPRLAHAGTYDEPWIEKRFPFLPRDFDDRYFQSAAPDQQMSYLNGGEVLRCINMTSIGHFAVTIPRIDIPITFKFWDRNVAARPNLDTLIVEPCRDRIMLIWRTRVPLGRKIHALREITIGSQPRPRRNTSKPHFKSIADFIAWKKQRSRQ